MSKFNVMANKNPKLFSSFNVEDVRTPEGFFNKNYVSVSFLVNDESILQIIIVNVIVYFVLASYLHVYFKAKKGRITEEK